MTIYEHLKADHKKVEDLLNRLVEASDDDKASWKTLVDKIRDELIPHARAEEAVFYNVIRELDPGNSLIRHSYAEHLMAETDLRSLQAMKAIDVNWTALARKLRDDILHHVEEEEGKVFPAARELISAEDAREIGDVFQKLKPQIKKESIVGTTFDLVANLIGKIKKAA